jgi:hypothetical protein
MQLLTLRSIRRLSLPGRSGNDLGKIGPPKQEATYSSSVPQHLPTSIEDYSTTLAYETQYFYGNYAMAAPPLVYSANHYGMPVNVQHGAVLTEARGMFIQNLSFKCTPEDLCQLLFTVGYPVDQRLIKDPRTGVFKGEAHGHDS